MKVVAGVDVGKQYLDVSIAGGAVKRFDNSDSGLKALQVHLEQGSVTEVVCEPTGGYEKRLVRYLPGLDKVVHVVHANKIRAFAQASGYLAKTDQLDAKVLSHYGEVFELSAGVVVDEQSEYLRGLLRRREQLIEHRVQETNRLEKGLEGEVRDSCERHVAWLTEELQMLDRRYREYLQATPPLAQQAQLYQSVRGVGELTAALLIADLPELGQLNSKALTALVGLAPWACDSGQQRGYRAIRGGRAGVRKALYMSALSAVRYDGQMKQFYQRLRQRGKAGKVALVAVMRKLLLVLNAIAQRGTPWVEAYASTK